MRDRGAGRGASPGRGGFTLVELMIVLATSSALPGTLSQIGRADS